MAALIALLRGINVGGKSVTMGTVRASFAAVGCEVLQTYLQSGNVLFVGEGLTRILAQRIVEQLRQDSGLDVAVLVKTGATFARVVRENPFLEDGDASPSELYVTFLASAPAKAGWSALAAIESGADRYRQVGTEVYVHCPHGYGRTKLSNNAVEKALGVVATTRNWRTVTKLAAMAAAP